MSTSLGHLDESGFRLVISAGSPTAQEIAVVSAAVTAVATAAAGEEGDATPSSSPWAVAARLEGIGARPVAHPGDLGLRAVTQR